MKLEVGTRDEVFGFKADNYEVDPNGRLWVGEEDDYEATFNVGEWVFVQFVKEVDTQPELPRVWESLSDVPSGLRVLDRDGDPWVGEPGFHSADSWGPFTEVVE